LQEQAVREHHRLLLALADQLALRGWTDIEEIPGGVDLWATSPTDGSRTIFEVKTLTEGTEVQQCRAAISQLLEYRFFYGSSSDRLCVVVNAPVGDHSWHFWNTSEWDWPA
jgi:hypothetical protein